MFRVLLIAALFFTASCTKGQGISLAQYKDAGASPQNFWICHGFNCSYKTRMEISKEGWSDILALFNQTPKNAAAERVTIARAVRDIERYINENSGMNIDRGKAVRFEKDEDQMDCIDETVNTSLYLKFIDEAGVLKFHKAAPPVHRGFMVDGMWPHNSAAVRELESGDIYVIDSYYYDSGENIAVVPFPEWHTDWHPADVPRD